MRSTLYQIVVWLALPLIGCTHPSEFNEIDIPGVSKPVISLNGTWKFALIPPEKHWENSIDFQHWSDIQVPGECQMQGFPITHDQPFVYKKQFDVPDDFDGSQIHLKFYGVYSYARVWVNGHFIRDHYGGFTKWSCNITEHVKGGESATLTVEVMDRSDDISYGSGYAKHQIGGILRDVELVAIPNQHFRQLHFETNLDAQYEHADLKIFYELSQDTPVRAKIEILDSEHKSIKRVDEKLLLREGELILPVTSPEKWDAEHPNLYTLVITLYEDGKELYKMSDKIGFREVVVKGNQLLVNGRPIKLRGACRHDIHPTLGRMTTPEYDKKDVLLAKECNMNFIRTSHYPPSEAFLDYCDEYGIYVEDETAVCFVGSHRTKAYRATGASQNSEEFTSRYLSQLEEMVQNHRNHPSIIIWSIVNENVFGENFLASFNWVKSHDSSRPVIYSYPGQVPDSLNMYEILSMHYPSWRGDLNQYGISTNRFESEEMPVLFDEWAHVACYNNFELKEDPNVRNFWSQSLDSMWTYTFEADGGLGGAIWCMLDETFMLPEDLPGYNEWWGILDKNVIPATYMGPCVGYGEWGIVDTWRRKKPEFWGVKKAYSPTKVKVKHIDVFEPFEELIIPVQNRFDHTHFNELKIAWNYENQSGVLNEVNLAPHEEGELVFPGLGWKRGTKLNIRFFQNDTLLVDEFNISLGTRMIYQPECRSGNLSIHEEEGKISIRGNDFQLEVNKSKGLLENLIINDKVVVKSGPYLHLRLPAERIQYSTIVMKNYAEDWKCHDFRFELNQGVATLHTEGSYNQIKAHFTIQIDENGIFQIAYEADHSLEEKTIQEVGLTFITGNSFSKITWDRNPYFTAYPESHLGAALGEVDLSVRPEMGYRVKPNHNWEMDSKGFYYFGLDEELPYTHVARSLKENIYTYALLSGATTKLEVFSDGTQACRFDHLDGENRLIVNDQWDYNSLLWGNYMKQVPLEKSLRGHVTFSATL